MTTKADTPYAQSLNDTALFDFLDWLAEELSETPLEMTRGQEIQRRVNRFAFQELLGETRRRYPAARDRYYQWVNDDDEGSLRDLVVGMIEAANA